MNKYNVVTSRFSQGDQEYVSGIIPFKIINQVSEVLIYGDTVFGYQRETIKSHYNKIKQYLLEDKLKILPTSIILGADKKEIEKMLTPQKGNTYNLALDLSKKEKVFRIVDGQHRLRGIEEAAKEDPQLLEYLLNIVVLLIDERKRSIELNVFTNINSKAKRIKVDLAELAKYNYEILENDIYDLSRHIAIKTAFILKENNKSSIWHKAIKFDIHDEINLGLIGVTAFCESIDAIIKKYIEDNQVIPNKSKSETIHQTEISARKLAKFIDDAWLSVRQKWPSCFYDNFVVDNDGELIKTYFDGDYYIQRTFGAKTLNVILGEIVKEDGLGINSIKKFNEIIKRSKLKSDDWKTGNIFAGLSSDSGFRKARHIIKNEVVPY